MCATLTVNRAKNCSSQENCFNIATFSAYNSSAAKEHPAFGSSASLGGPYSNRPPGFEDEFPGLDSNLGG